MNRKINATFFGSTAIALLGMGVQAVAADEVIVTATKRAQSERDVPLSIEAFSGQELKDIGAIDFDDFAVRVPGLGFANSGPASLRGSSGGTGLSINIRGLGGTGGAGSTSTAYYLDETPVPSLNLKLVDVERVEILKGPQGTLYGARGFGGLVKIVTNRPRMNEFSGEIAAKISFTDDGGVNHEEELIVNIPIVQDTLSFRAAGYFVRNEGFVDQIPAIDALGNVDQSLAQEDVDDEKTEGARASLLFEPTENFTADLSFIYEHQGLDSLTITDQFLADNFDTLGTLSPTKEPVDNDIFNYNATLTFNAAAFDVTSSTSLFKEKAFNSEDRAFLSNFFVGQFTNPLVVASFLPALEAASLIPPGTTVASSTNTTYFPFGSFNTSDIDTESFIQEVRLASTHGGPFQWMVGGFYEDTKTDIVFFGESPGAIAAGTVALDAPGIGLIPFPVISTDVVINRRSDRSTRELAAFSELSYSFMDDLTFTAGLRYFDTEVSAGTEDLSASVFAPAIGPATFNQASEDGVTPKFLLSYRASDDALVYAQAVKGFRIGGFTDASAGTPTPTCQSDLAGLGITGDGIVEFESDDLWTYELGAKTSWIDGKLTIDGVAFYNDWQNLQQAILVPSCGISVTQNAGSARSFGFETELSAELAEGLMFSVAYGYLDSKITESDIGGLPEGSSFTLAPDHSIATSLSYSAPLPGSMSDFDGFVRVDYTYQSDTTFNFLQNFTSPQPAFDTINLRAGIFREDWQVSVFAENVANERAILADTTALQVGGASRVLGTESRNVRIMRPRTIGVSLRASF